MKENNIEEFFKKHKQTIADDGFSARLSAVLDCTPQPIIKEQNNTWIVVLISTLVGFIAFAIMGGYQIFIEGMMSASKSLATLSKFTPEAVLSIVFSMLLLAGLGRYAIKNS